MKLLKAIVLLAAASSVALLFTACAQGGGGGSAGTGSVTMYGTLDEGIGYVRR